MTEPKTTVSLSLPSPCRALSQLTGQNHDNISSPKAPILNLHNDILWWIFCLNADMEDEAEDNDEIAAIDTLRYSSQVCSRWRQIILSFSSLWGQVINLSHLEHDEWREEVLRRTGRSFLSVLWVYSDVACLCEDVQVQVAAKMLEHHWDRIRHLELDLTSPHSIDKLSIAQFCEIFRRPSDVLESFRITFENMENERAPILSPSDFIVFNNLAPALRTFNAPNIKFDLDAPWLANIRFLALNGQVSAYDLIQAIPHMPLLESLADETSSAISSSGDALSSLPHIRAPSLKEITLSSSSDMRPYMDFLAHIKPAVGCYLIFNHVSYGCDLETLALANLVLYVYSRCCDFARANDLCLGFNPYSFQFEAQIPCEKQFCFKLEFSNGIPQYVTVIEFFLEALPPIKFQDVETLDLAIASYFLEPADKRISRFILSVPSVETLTTDDSTLDYLLNFPSDVLALFFPLLHAVEISCCLLQEEISPVKRFLTSRIATGRPIKVLSMPIDPNSHMDLQSLDEFTGLTLILRNGDQEYEHTCRNGNVENLLIRPKYMTTGSEWWLPECNGN